MTLIDWTASMEQTFEYYIVDPGTWKDVRRIHNIKSTSISRNSQSETLGSASMNVTDLLDECYVRVYLIAVQNGVTEKVPLGTFLVQSPSSRFNGKVTDITVDAYTPLIELKESLPPLGYSVMKGDNVMSLAYRLTKEHLRAPVVETSNETVLTYDFVANTDDTWMSFLTDLIAYAKYSFDLDELGRVLFSPKQSTASLQPVWTYTDDNSSILYPDLSIDHDIFGIPNVVEVVYSKNGDIYYSRKTNDDENSPLSIQKRGREIVYRETNPDFPGIPSQDMIDEYAEQLLKDLSSFEHTVTYSHGYCPVRVGDCVRLNYKRAGLDGVKAKVISQTIDCSTGCKVSETAVFTKKLWR